MKCREKGLLYGGWTRMEGWDLVRSRLKIMSRKSSIRIALEDSLGRISIVSIIVSRLRVK